MPKGSWRKHEAAIRLVERLAEGNVALVSPIPLTARSNDKFVFAVIDLGGQFVHRLVGAHEIHQRPWILATTLGGRFDRLGVDEGELEYQDLEFCRQIHETKFGIRWATHIGLGGVRHRPEGRWLRGD